MSPLLIKLFLFVVCFTQEMFFQNCEPRIQKIKDSSIMWPLGKPSEVTYSEPPCYDESMELKSGVCVDGNWNLPECTEIQKDLNPCPEDLKLGHKVCYIVTPHAEFTQKCPYDEELPFSPTYVSDFEATPPVWMPVRRDIQEDEIGVFKWIEHTSKFKFSSGALRNATNILNNCVIFYNETYQEAVPCTGKYPKICAYKILNEKVTYCNQKNSDCKQGTYHNKTDCLCKKDCRENECTSPADLLVPYQNLFFVENDDQCHINLHKVNSSYVWGESKTPLNYTFWSTEERYSDTTTEVVLTKTGWILIDIYTNPKNCYISRRSISKKTPTISSKRNESHLVVTVSNIYDLKQGIFCYTTASPYTIQQNYTTMAPELIFELEKFSGDYWCESYEYPDLNLVRSNTVTANSTQKYEYKAEFTYAIDTVLGDFVQDAQNAVQDCFESLDYFVKTAKVFGYSPGQNTVRLIVRFLRKNRTKFCDEDYTLLSDQIAEATRNSPLKLVKLYNKICQGEVVSLGENIYLTWASTPVDSSAYSKESCNNQKVKRSCLSSAKFEAVWEKVTPNCHNWNYNITETLEEIYRTDDETLDYITDQLAYISEHYEEFTAYHVQLYAKIFQKIAREPNLNLESITETFSNINNVPREALHDSEKNYNRSATSLLKSFDTIYLETKSSNATAIVTENIMSLAANLSQLGAVVLTRQSGVYNLTVIEDDLTSFGKFDFEVALFVPSELREQLVSSNATKLVVVVYIKDSLFLGEANQSSEKIFDVLIPGFQEDFDAPLSLIFKSPGAEEKQFSRNCAHWNYGEADASYGFWKNDNDSIDASPDFLVCEFWHVTHFALLLLKEAIDDKYHILDLITSVNSILSMSGLVAIILTAILFKKWRSNTGNQILINFVFAIALQIGVFYISGFVSLQEEIEDLCTVVGAVLHYSVISEFSWMLIIAILQFKRFVEVFGGPPNYILLKACVCGWILPLFPVCVVLFLDPKTYIKGSVGLCYPSGLSLYLGIWLPISIIVAINIVIFIFILYSVCHRDTDCYVGGSNDSYMQWSLAILLFFMLGITWSFGLLTQLNYGFIFAYLFCFSATLQGFVIFLFFIVLNKDTRGLYVHLFKQSFKKDKSGVFSKNN